MTHQILDHLFITPSVVFRSDVGGVRQPTGLDSELDTPWELNGNIVYSPTETLDIFISLRNITDEKNAQQGFIGAAPQDGARGSVGLRYKF